jgi:hypothetical protein
MQAKIAEEQGIALLLQLMVAPPSVEIQVEVAYTLGCVVLNNKENQERLKQQTLFKFDSLLELLNSNDDVSKVSDVIPELFFPLCRQCG